MAIPSYKKVHIISENKSDIFKQLESFQYGRIPYIFIIEHLGSMQGQVIKYLEDFIQTYNINIKTYPIHVITSEALHSNSLNLFSHISQCPRFFNQKIKQLNVKENSLLKKLLLKQSNLQNIQESECLPILQEYAKAHRALFNLEKEKDFLSELSLKLEEQYEQK